MTNTTIHYIVHAAAAVLSVGILAGCAYCQPLLLVAVLYLVASQNIQNEVFAS